HRRFPSIHVEASIGRGGWGWNVLCERIPARIGISEENIAPDGELGLSKNREQYSTADGGDLSHNRLLARWVVLRVGLDAITLSPGCTLGTTEPECPDLADFPAGRSELKAVSGPAALFDTKNVTITPALAS